jgi:polysaccharide export outer membrane protein
MMEKSKSLTRLRFTTLLGLFIFGLHLSCSFLYAQSGAVNQLAGDQSSPNITIGAGDLLNIVVFDTPELTTSVRVTQDGDVNLPVLGLLRVAGLSTSDAALKMEKELRSRQLILDPHVTIFVTEYASQGATIMGEVRTPGVYPTLGTRKLLDMLSLAGGVQATAGKAVSIVHRNDPQHPVTVALQSSPANLYAQENPIILPGDTIIVAKAGVV